MSRPNTRRRFIGSSALAAGALAFADLSLIGKVFATDQMKPKVFFSRDISVDGLKKIYAKINQQIQGEVAIKLHTGEPNGPNLLPIELIKGLQPTIPNSSIVETNVLYPSPRQKTETHREVIKTNGFDFCPVDILDAEGDATLPIKGMQEFLDEYADLPSKDRPYREGRHLTEVAVGKHLLNYDSLVVYTHFKGHAMGGFGGSLKNIAIGCASGQVGKKQIHGEGWPTGELFLERMVEGGKAITDHFGENITYINVLKNLSVDCDCDANGVAPTCGDIGILGSTDILAIDQASIDLVYAMPEEHRRDLVERIETRSGLHQLEYMETLQMGSREYELVTL